MHGVVHGPMVPRVRAPDECDAIGRNAKAQLNPKTGMKPYEGKHEPAEGHETLRGKT